ncbi:hypothetical protein V2J09_015087 [Rumex salicifolius]
MEKLREMVMKLATADQKKTLWPSQITQIEHHLQMAFPSGLHTPNHPPYAAMIYKAITNLDEEGGSSEESISEYIKAEYKDLPFAHKSFLSLHLSKLCDKGFVVFTTFKRYIIHNLTIASNEMICATPPPSDEYNNFSENEQPEENNNVRKRNKPRRMLVFDKEDERDEICNTVTTNLRLSMEVNSLDGKGKGRTGSKGESSKGLVKRKKKDIKKWLMTALSDLSDEEKPEEIHMPVQIIDYIERKDPSCLHESLVQTRFFDECKIHSNADDIKKCNSYCVDCMNGALCNSCRSSHKDHNLIRITQSMWENVVPATQIQMYIDISEIQIHIINHKGYISLKRTVKTRHRKHFTGACLICKRYLPESFKFCSLYCKVYVRTITISGRPTGHTVKAGCPTPSGHGKLKRFTAVRSEFRTQSGILQVTKIYSSQSLTLTPQGQGRCYVI